MAISGYVNIDCLIHDAAASAFKAVDVESSLAVSGKVALVTGQATAGGVDIDPAASGYRDATGAAVSMASLSAVVVKGTADLTLVAGDVQLFAPAGQAAYSGLDSYAGNVTVSGDGNFDLVMIGPA